jgi:hypothetical protein
VFAVAALEARWLADLLSRLGARFEVTADGLLTLAGD